MSKPKTENASEAIRTPSGQVLMLTVSMEPVQRKARAESPTLRELLRAHLAKMAEVTNA